MFLCNPPQPSLLDVPCCDFCLYNSQFVDGNDIDFGLCALVARPLTGASRQVRVFRQVVNRQEGKQTKIYLFLVYLLLHFVNLITSSAPLLNIVNVTASGRGVFVKFSLTLFFVFS